MPASSFFSSSHLPLNAHGKNDDQDRRQHAVEQLRIVVLPGKKNAQRQTENLPEIFAIEQFRFCEYAKRTVTWAPLCRPRVERNQPPNNGKNGLPVWNQFLTSHGKNGNSVKPPKQTDFAAGFGKRRRGGAR